MPAPPPLSEPATASTRTCGAMRCPLVIERTVPLSPLLTSRRLCAAIQILDQRPRAQRSASQPNQLFVQREARSVRDHALGQVLPRLRRDPALSETFLERRARLNGEHRGEPVA